MTKPGLSTELDIKIPFHDVDMMEITWHGHYVRYFEIVRCQLLDQIDYNYQQMSLSGYAWPVIDMRIRYVKPARFGETVTVKATLVEWENRLKVEYLITNKKGERLTKGYTVQVAVKIETQEMQYSSPAILLDKLGAESVNK